MMGPSIFRENKHGCLYQAMLMKKARLIAVTYSCKREFMETNHSIVAGT